MSYKNVLAIIPARRGSKRFPGKNTALFQGKPLVQNTIRIAEESGIKKILVTTDDYNVALIADHEEVVCMERPEDLCTDTARTEEVVENAVHYAMSATDGPHWEFDTICLLQVTSPLLHPDSLKTALDTYSKAEETSLVAINSFFEPCGAFYIVNRELFMRKKSFYQEGGHLYILPADQCLDVDHEYNLRICEAVYKGHVI